MICQAVVAENYDDKNKGMIKVRIPLMEEGRDLTAFVAVMQGYATKNGGFFFLPEKDDIVLVAFMGGGFERGVVLGSLYSKDNGFASGAATEKNDFKIIASRCGSQIRFSDEDGKEKVIISTPKGREILFDEENEIVIIKAKDETLVKINGKDGEISLTAKEKITLSCGKAKINLPKDGNVSIEGENIEIKGKTVGIKGADKTEVTGQTLALKGSTEAKLSSDTKLTLSGASAAELKGGMVKING